ncbi:MAG: sensor histidine kinase [Cyanobium sp.]
MLIMGVALGRLSSNKATRFRNRHQPTREQLLSWIDQVTVGWLILDKFNRVIFINEKAQRLLGISSSRRAPVTLAYHGNHDVLMDLIENVRDYPQPKRLEWDFAQQDLEVFAYPGQAGTVALLFQSRRSLEAQLDQQERWVSDVAHELKTPLTALLLVGDSLAGDVTDQNAIRVERLLKELRRMRELVGDLLELSRLENVIPGEGLEKKQVDLVGLVDEVWNGLKPIADEKMITMCLHIDIPTDNNESYCVAGDSKRLHRALLNLLDNALRFSPENGEIHVDFVATSNWVRVGIRDQGIGLTQQDLEQMFDRFYRGDSSRFRQLRGGSGLGLAIVQQIALAHGGWIFGENDSRGGARFELRLPK